MTAPTTRDALRQPLANHFIMWRFLDVDGRRGEWFCSCGAKFGFSDTAIDHQRDALITSGAVVDADTLADDEALIYDRLLPWMRTNPVVRGSEVGSGVHHTLRALAAALTERGQA